MENEEENQNEIEIKNEVGETEQSESFSTTLENTSIVTNTQESTFESNTLISNQEMFLEKLDQFHTILNGIFFLICLWFVIDLMRKMLEMR